MMKCDKAYSKVATNENVCCINTKMEIIKSTHVKLKCPILVNMFNTILKKPKKKKKNT